MFKWFPQVSEAAGGRSGLSATGVTQLLCSAHRPLSRPQEGVLGAALSFPQTEPWEAPTLRLVSRPARGFSAPVGGGDAGRALTRERELGRSFSPAIPPFFCGLNFLYFPLVHLQ